MSGGRCRGVRHREVSMRKESTLRKQRCGPHKKLEVPPPLLSSIKPADGWRANMGLTWDGMMGNGLSLVSGKTSHYVRGALVSLCCIHRAASGTYA